MVPDFKRVVKKNWATIAFESCTSQANRLYRMSQNGGNYFR